MKLRIVLLFFFLWSFSYSQKIIHYTIDEGLPGNYVYRISQDNEGFVWFITDKGMVKYNGLDFKVFTAKDGLPANDIWDIRITPDNKVWYFSKSSRLGYIENDTVYSFSSKEKNKIFFPVSINQSGNQISFKDRKITYLFNGSEWIKHNNSANNTFVIAHPEVKQLKYDKQKNSVLIFDKDQKLLKEIKIKSTAYNKKKYYGQLNDSLFCWMLTDRILLFNLNTKRLHRIELDKEQEYYRFTYSGNSIQFTGQDYLAILQPDYTLRKIHLPENIHSHFSFLDNSGNLWMATFMDGVYFIPSSHVNTTYYLKEQKVRKIKNLNGELYATVFNKGFFKLDKKKKSFKKYFEKKDYVPFTMYHSEELKTDFFITSEKIYIRKDKHFKIVGNKDYMFIKDILYHRNLLYGIAPYDLIILQPDGFRFLKSLDYVGIRKLYEFDGRLLIGAYNGLKVLENDTIRSEGKLIHPVISINSIEDRLIIGTDGYGAYLVKGKNEYELLEDSDFLSVSDIEVSGDQIFLASNSGVIRYRLSGDGSIKQVMKYTIEDGLLSDACHGVLVENDNILCTSDMGIAEIPLDRKSKKALLDIYFESLSYGEHTLSLQKSNILYTKGSRLTAKISAIDFSIKKDFEYEYKLEPIQSEWIPTRSRSIEYSELKPGTYTLKIRKDDLLKEVRISIEPHWWQTLWFKILALLFSVGLVILLTLWGNRKRQDKKNKALMQEKLLTQLQLKALRSQMNPHFVFNSLAAIQYYINENDLVTSDRYLV